MDVNKAYETLERYFSNEFIEGRQTRYVIESAEESWMMPLAWLYAATACARDGDKKKFKNCLNEAKRMYGEFTSRRDASDKVIEEEDAAHTLCNNIDKAFELVKKNL
ncbi:MAG: hypothetical protein KAT43_03580 [Nanoarchaeota archaeon]|nr:hypothetical protein [Nanoarchaeota archaeon]